MNDASKEKLKYIMANISYYQALKGVNDLHTSTALGISRQMFSFYRKGDAFPTLERIMQIAEYLGCEVSDLLKTGASPSAAKET